MASLPATLRPPMFAWILPVAGRRQPARRRHSRIHGHSTVTLIGKPGHIITSFVIRNWLESCILPFVIESNITTGLVLVLQSSRTGVHGKDHAKASWAQSRDQPPCSGLNCIKRIVLQFRFQNHETLAHAQLLFHRQLLCPRLFPLRNRWHSSATPA